MLADLARKPLLVFSAVLIILVFYTFLPRSTSISDLHVERTHLSSPFTGAFARFPRVSALPARQRRITLVAVWNDDFIPPYLRHFYYSIQKNADSVDLLVVNRLLNPGKQCLDFDKAGIDIKWGGNIKVVCLSDEEWKQHFVDHMCSEEYGWSCDEGEYAAVSKQYALRNDHRNFEWRPLIGHAFRKHFADPEAAFWAWIDSDQIVGDMRHYPFNILSQVSLITGRERFPVMMMAGQLTAFNLDDKATGSAWKKFVGLRSPADFVEHADGEFPNSPEEQYWSQGYLRSDEQSPGSDLSFVIYPGLHADDFFGSWGATHNTQAHVMSGRDVFTMDTSFSRQEIEGIIALERGAPIDDLGGLGWTTGEDGSGMLLRNHTLPEKDARRMATEATTSLDNGPYRGLLSVEHVAIDANCTMDPTVKWVHQCIPAHPLSRSTPLVYRESVVRLREQQPMVVFRRLERDTRPRGYERKLIRHHLYTLSHGNEYGKGWFELPPFDITDDMVLQSNNDFVAVWKMGPTREETLFFRGDGKKPIG